MVSQNCAGHTLFRRMADSLAILLPLLRPCHVTANAVPVVPEPFLFKPFSAFPAQLRCCLLLEVPQECPFCPFLCLVNISHRLCCPMQARLLGPCSPNTRVGCPVQRWLYITTVESGPHSSLATLPWASPTTFVMPQFPHWKEGEAVTPGVCVAAHRHAVAPFQASSPSPSLG